jgi:hypothetical protein
MSSLANFAIALVFIATTAAPVAAQPIGTPLARLAVQDGYTYAWLADEAGVQLSKPGVVIEFRAGQTLYRVGDRVLAADVPPYFNGSDLVVSASVAEQLARIAQAYPIVTPPPAPPPAATSGTGALTVEARIANGMEAVAIRGHGPANVPITVTLTGEISRDLPVVVLSRTATRTASDGTYSVIVGIAAGPPRGSTIVATVTSLTGITPGSARLQIDRPSPNIVDSPADADPQ